MRERMGGVARLYARAAHDHRDPEAVLVQHHFVARHAVAAEVVPDGNKNSRIRNKTIPNYDVFKCVIVAVT